MTRLLPGLPHPLGLTLTDAGANLALPSAHAARIDWCLFDAQGRETARLPLPERTGDIHHGFLPGMKDGDAYGLRVHGPWDPDAGHRFNPAKLLLDPWARALTAPVRWSPALRTRAPDGGPDPADSGAAMPKCLARRDPPPIDPAERPNVPWDRTVIYEAHVKSLTMLHPEVPEPLRGTYDALGHPAVIAHLQALGVTALELMPVTAFMDEPRLTAMGLVNHWGYNPYGFLIPEHRFHGPSGADGLRQAVRRLHEAGIEVILDFVPNHTAELDDSGPVLHLRGLDDAGFHLHAPGEPRGYVNHSGCGNTVDLGNPGAQRLMLDALRWWAQVIGADGFRFDLGAVMGRAGGRAFDPEAAFLHALRQDPVLGGLKLIAEPWDIGPGGYVAGQFPAPFAEWNDGLRDAARRAWRGDRRGAHDLAGALLGSAQRFDRNGRRPWSSINFVASHDGFTLADQTMFATRRNIANGEGNRDGHAGEVSDAMGPEGPSRDPAVTAARDRRRRALLATQFVAQGVPMLRMGDEVAHSQGGNNNAYCQDNPVSWIDWAAGDADLLAFARACGRLRARLPVLRQPRFLHGALRADGRFDAEWLGADGGPPAWEDDRLPAKLLLLRGSAEAPEGTEDPAPVLLALNFGAAPVALALPEAGPGLRWRMALDTTTPRGDPDPDRAPGVLPPGALLVWEGAPEDAPGDAPEDPAA